jgi:hypothetical protein
VKTPTPTPPALPNPTPEPAPEPAPVATPEPTVQPSPATTLSGLAATKAKPAAKPKMIRPLPTIRISGNLTKAGANVTRLSITAPKGVRITLVCSGRGCPLRSVAQASAVFHIQQFERELRAGTKLKITVTKPGHISKVTTITIRKGKSPARLDRCQIPGQSQLIRCPKR